MEQGSTAGALSEAPSDDVVPRRGYQLTLESWVTVWDRSAPFRRIWRTSTVIWGLGAIADAVVRLAMAMTLPIDLVPGLNAILYPATFVALQIVTNVYYHRAGLWGILHASWAGSARAGSH